MKFNFMSIVLLLYTQTLISQIDLLDLEQGSIENRPSLSDDLPEWYTVCLDETLISKVEYYFTRHGGISDWEELFRIDGINLSHIECLYANFGAVEQHEEYSPSKFRLRIRHDYRPLDGDTSYGVDQYGQISWLSPNKELFFQWETDRAEWTNRSPAKPADYASGYISVSGLPMGCDILLGDFAIGHGQGLISYAGLFASPGAGAANLIRVGRGIRGYRSKTESGFQRGACMKMEIGRKKVHSLSLWYSRSPLDAKLLGNENNSFWQTLDLSGDHSSSEGLQKKAALRWTSSGGTIRYSLKRGTLYGMIRTDAFSSPFDPGDQIFRAGLPKYSKQASASMAFDGKLGKLTTWGEIASQSTGGTAFLLGWSRPINSKMSITSIARYANASYHAPFSGGFFKRNPPRNESGFFFSLEARPNSNWKLNSYWNTWFFPGVRYLFDTPTSGMRFFISVTHTKRRAHQSSLQWLLEKDEDPDIQPILFLKRSYRLLSRFRFHYEKTPNKNWRIMMRLEFSGDPRLWGKQFGHLLYWDLLYQPLESRWRLTGRFTWADIASYDWRISAFESDVLGRFRIYTYSAQMLGFNFSARRKFSDLLTLDWSSKLLLPSDFSSPIWNHSLQLQFGFSSERSIRK